MKSEFDKLISYINDNLRFGSKIRLSIVEQWFNKYSLTLKEKFLIYEELDSLKIEVLNLPQKQSQALIAKLYTCIKNEKEIEKELITEWFIKNNIDEDIQKNFIEEYINKNDKIIIENDIFNKPTEEKDFDFLNDFIDDDLDTLLDDEDFFEEVDSLKDVVDKSRNIEYLTQIKSSNTEENKRALDNLAEANINLVWKITNHYLGLGTSSFDQDDMYQTGMIGLMKAAEKFDISLGYAFSTYAVNWIRQAITRDIANYSTLIRIPVHYREKLNKLIRVENDLWNELARPATKLELSKKMEVTIHEIEEMKFYIDQSNLASLDTYVGANEDTNLVDIIPDETVHTPETYLIDADKRSVIREILSSRLTDREEEIIYYRFGLIDGSEGMTLEEIGDIYNVTRERIRQIESKALARLKHYRSTRVLRGYLYEC